MEQFKSGIYAFLKKPGIAIVLLYGIYIISLFRTSTVGNSSFFDYLLIASIFVFPFAVAQFLHLHWKKTIRNAVVLVGSCIAISLTLATLEEQVQKTKLPDPNQHFHTERWFPFQHHSMVYVPGEGWFGHD